MVLGENLVDQNTIKLPNIDLSDNPDIETAAKLIFRESIKHLRSNFKKFQKSGNPAALMQIRIGMRRIRVGLTIFRPIIPKEVRSRFNREFRYFGNMLGHARNMDVFLQVTLTREAKKAPHKKAYSELRLHAEAWRDEEYEVISRELFGGHFESMVKEFDKWVSSDWSTKLGRAAKKLMAKPVAPFALTVLEEGGTELLNQGTEDEHLSADELHDVRKYAKRARYHLRFFSSLFNEDKVHEGFQILIEMQDCLGHINDVKEGMIILSQIAEDVRADCYGDVLRLAADILTDASEEIDQHLKQFNDLWKRYEAFSIGKDDLRK